MKSFFIKRMVAGLLLWSLSGSVLALNNADYSFFIHGFISQGFIKSTGNNFFGNSKDGSFDLFQGGLSLYYAPFETISLAAGLKKRNLGDYYYNEQNLDLEYLRVTARLFNSQHVTAHLTAGKSYIPIGFFNEARDNPFGHTGILLSQTMYSEYLRTRNLSAKGARLDLNVRGNWGMIDFVMARGSTYKAIPEVAFYYNPSFRFDGDVDFPLSDVYRIIYHAPNGRFKIGYNIGEFYQDGTDMTTGISENDDYHWQMLSFQYDFNNLTWITEIYETRFDSSATISPAPGVIVPLLQLEVTGHGWYSQLAWRFTPDQEVFIRYDCFDPFAKDPNNSAALRSAAQQNYSEWVLGYERYLAENWLFKTEIHRFDGAYLAHWTENDLNNLSKNWSLFLAQINYRF